MKYTYVSQKVSAREKTAYKNKSNWQPWTLSAPFLQLFLCICILFAVFIEILLRASEGHQGFILSDPTASSFVFNYLPTIIAVVFSLLWATVAHDYLRLEPYFQLSKPEGVTAKHSLLLDYSYAFPHLILWTAFKRRHYAVFYSTLISLLIVLAMVPLISGLFDEKVILRIRETNVSQSPLYSVEDQEQLFSTGFASMAYIHTWLNGSLPPFTTSEYAISPFQIKSSDLKYQTNETWVGETILYETDPGCKAAEITTLSSGPNYQGLAYNISNGGDCYYEYYEWPSPLLNAPKLGLYANPWTSIVVGHAKDNLNFSKPHDQSGLVAYLEDQLHMTNCSNTNTFLAIWASEKGRANKTYVGSQNITMTSRLDLPENFTAVFCEPKYYYETVRATVQMPAGVIQSIERFGGLRRFEQFNSTKFHYLTTIGGISQLPKDYDSQGNVVGLEYIPAEIPEVDYQLAKRFGAQLSTNGAGTTSSLNEVYGLGGPIAGFSLYNRTNETLVGLLDTEELARTYNEAYKLLFAFGVSLGMTDLNSTAGISTSVTREFKARVFVMDALWSKLSQAGFGVLSILTICLLISTWGRQTNLDGEPNSLASGLGLLAESNALIRDLYNSEYHDQRDLHKLLSQSTRRYRLHLVDGKGPRVEAIGLESDTLLPQLPTDSEDMSLVPFQAMKSWHIRISTGITYFIIFGGILGFLIYLFVYDLDHNGLPTVAAPNSSIYKVLFSYLPTTVGILIGPVWGALGSYACMVGPYESLRHGRASSPKSLSLDYDRSPPHFQLRQALSAGNFILGALTIAILLVNLLAVAFSGLFLPRTAEFVIATEVDRFNPPNITGSFRLANDEVSSYKEVFYLLNGNLSGWIPRPSWNTPEFYVLPFNTSATEEKTVIRQGTTMGFGADISCDLVPEDKVLVSQKPVTVSVNETVIYNSIKIDHKCWVNEVQGTSSDGYAPNVVWTETQSPAFYFGVPSLSFSDTSCDGMFFVGWAERPGDPRPTNFTYPYLDRTDSAVLLCNASVKAAEMTASVNEDDIVVSIDNVKLLSAKALGDLFTKSSDFFTPQSMIMAFMNNIMPSTGSAANVGGLYTQWINVLLTQEEPSLLRNLTNATSIPDTARLAETFESVYKSLFAFDLQLFQNEIFEFGETQRVPGTATVLRERVQVSRLMFWLAAGVLVYFLLVVVLVFWSQPGHNLSHMPTTLASVHTLLYVSNALDDCANIKGQSTEVRAKAWEALGHTYGYGTFVGRDGRQHFGVYREDNW